MIRCQARRNGKRCSRNARPDEGLGHYLGLYCWQHTDRRKRAVNEYIRLDGQWCTRTRDDRPWTKPQAGWIAISDYP